MDELTDARDATLTVEPSRLHGQVRLSGAKNSVLRLLAASLLTSAPMRLANCPHRLLDVRIHVGMLEALGKSCRVVGDDLEISETAAPPSDLAWDGRSIRNTLLILGALLARTGAGSVPLPGGCQLGERKHDLHELVFTRLGARVREEGGRLHATAPPGGLVGTDIHLPLRSTGATENAILCGSLARGTTTLWNPHIRPEILDLVECLKRAGARIAVHGQERIVIEGVAALGAVEHRVIPDNMEAVTWAVAAAITGGDVEILDFPWEHLEVPLAFLRAAGVRIFRGEVSAIVRGGPCYPVELSTGPYPGINSDMQPLFAVLGQRSRGESRIIDLRFPGRYAYADELARMGMRHRVRDNLLVIDGGDPLRGAEVTALDLRAGAALMIAGLTAAGTTTIRRADQILRGYDDVQGKLRALGARSSWG